MSELSITTIRPFSRKYNVPENLLRSLVKRNLLPGFYEGSRFYINEQQAVEMLNQISKREAVAE